MGGSRGGGGTILVLDSGLEFSYKGDKYVVGHRYMRYWAKQMFWVMNVDKAKMGVVSQAQFEKMQKEESWKNLT